MTLFYQFLLSILFCPFIVYSFSSFLDLSLFFLLFFPFLLPFSRSFPILTFTLPIPYPVSLSYPLITLPSIHFVILLSVFFSSFPIPSLLLFHSAFYFTILSFNPFHSPSTLPAPPYPFSPVPASPGRREQRGGGGRCQWHGLTRLSGRGGEFVSGGARS